MNYTEFTFDELILMYDIVCKSLFNLGETYNVTELKHYNELREKLFQALQDKKSII